MKCDVHKSHNSMDMWILLVNEEMKMMERSGNKYQSHVQLKSNPCWIVNGMRNLLPTPFSVLCMKMTYVIFG